MEPIIEGEVVQRETSDGIEFASTLFDDQTDPDVKMIRIEMWPLVGLTDQQLHDIQVAMAEAANRFLNDAGVTHGEPLEIELGKVMQ